MVRPRIKGTSYSAEDEIFTDVRKSDMAYPFILLRQVERCNMAFSSNELEAIVNAVQQLERLLKPYHDKEYNIKAGALKRIKFPDVSDISEKELKEMDEEDIKERIAPLYNKKIREREEKRFELLMELMARKNLLLEEFVEMTI